MERPVEERRQVLARQAEEMKAHDEEPRGKRAGKQREAVCDYDTGRGLTGGCPCLPAQSSQDATKPSSSVTPPSQWAPEKMANATWTRAATYHDPVTLGGRPPGGMRNSERASSI